MLEVQRFCTSSKLCSIYGLDNGAFCFFLNSLLHKSNKRVCIVVPTEREITKMLSDIETAGFKASVFPWWGNLAYRGLAKNSSVFAERVNALLNLAESKSQIVLMSQRSFITAVPPPEYITQNCINIFVGDKTEPEILAEELTHLGFLRVSKVSMRGEFAMRGEVLDIAPMYSENSEEAFRIQFDFDKIEKIKRFNILTQDSKTELKKIRIAPVKEVIWDKTSIKTLKKNILSIKDFEKDFYEKTNEENISQFFETFNETKTFANEELFFPLCFEKKYSVLDYLSEDSLIIFSEYTRMKNASDLIAKEYESLYKKAVSADDYYLDKNFSLPLPKPEYFIFNFENLITSDVNNVSKIFLKNFTQSEIEKDGLSKNETSKIETQNEKESEQVFTFNIDGAKSFFGNIIYLKESVQGLLENNWSVFIFAESEHQALRIKAVLKDFPVEVLPHSISAGFSIPQLKLTVINENEIFGRQRRIPKSVTQARSSVIDVFIDLSVGDYIVHVNYGIGQFRGIERVKTMGTERDYIELLYANEERLFIPIEQADLVQKYLGGEGQAPRLDTLGSKSWEARKSKVKKEVEDLAGKLLELYSKRKASQGFAFPPDDEWQLAFEAAFPYEETEDQLTCTEEIKSDMEKSEPMDRLLCGDVGYGKTEVAMRACFKACMAGKQTAFLAPTTILAEQHYQTLLERFKNFPVKIAKLSRFVTKSEQKKTLKDLLDGKIDILVGTHRIIQKDVKFKDLGLMIIDEEQRFGVKDKERLKKMRYNVDCLAMSATPIPRTLHMSLLKIRKMSLITTPPQNRKPVETYIHEFDISLVTKAIRNEIERDGQVFYLHNRIESLDETRYILQKAMPEVLFETAHGQMTADEIEETFMRFNAGGFQVLICTTIIENGIDIPNANTIIIDRADMYGVSQLYQLRGRVGRSDKNAFAYLLYPEGKVLSEVSVKRLQTISDFTELGSGFKVAMKDMEIRGVGNLLGKQQSGNIYSVGFDLYLHLLDTAIRELENKNYTPEIEPVVELEYSGFIPDSYIKSEDTKMEIYKKIAAVRTESDFDTLVANLSDRFGYAPIEVESLLALAEIKIICKKLSVLSLKERNGKALVEFSQVTKISIDKLLKIIQHSHGRIYLDGTRPNIVILETGNIGLKEKSEFIKEQLGQLL
ncbi:MAG: transcription-repair coupling factor [Treponemataceae bacterium]